MTRLRLAVAVAALALAGCGQSLVSPDVAHPRDAGVAHDQAVPDQAVPDGAVPDLSTADLVSADLSEADLLCDPAACTQSTSACQVAACVSGACGFNNSSATACTDNGGKLCSSNGTCVQCLQPTDCKAATTSCVTVGCDGSGSCTQTPVAKGTGCNDSGGVVCDGKGACVASHCADGIKDGDESDVDCGGSCGSDCTDTPPQKCGRNADCQSGVCATASPVPTCQVPTCGDHVKNGNETDTDCGGAGYEGQPACPACADRSHCSANSDCQNGDCYAAPSPSPALCVSCSDNIQDGDETGDDCGGLACDAAGKTCGATVPCGVDADCTSGLCKKGVCTLRPDGNSCTINSQCANSHCVSGICCNTACTATCMQCGTGKCAVVPAASPAPTGQCAPSSTNVCGNNGLCDGAGNCEKEPITFQCGGQMCSGSTLTAPTFCNGTGKCNTPVTSQCLLGLDCSGDGMSCLTTCTQDSDCANQTTTYCAGGLCVPKISTGTGCTNNDQCGSGQCLTNCCATACTGGECGATLCTPTLGACSYPTGTSCNMGAGICDGLGGCTPI